MYDVDKKKHISQHVTLHSNEKVPNTLTVTDDFICSQLTLPKDPVDECDWDFTDAVTQCLGTNHHLHLKHITAGLSKRDYSLQYVFLI